MTTIGDDPTSERRRCVFIGPGRWGRVLLPHVRAAFDVVAVVDRGSPESRSWLSKECSGIPTTTNYAEALSLPGVEVAFLATPTSTHADLTVLALEAGCHVFVEKPLALRATDAAWAVRAAQEKQLEVFIGYVYLHHPGLEVLRGLAAPSLIQSIRFDWTRPGLVGAPREELLCHELALVIAITGEIPIAIDVWRDDGSVFEAAMRLPSGRPVSMALRAPPTGLKRKSVAIACSDGAVHEWCDDSVSTTIGRATRSVGCPPELAVPLEVAAFREAIDGSRPRMVDDPRLSVGIAEVLELVASGDSP